MRREVINIKDLWWKYTDEKDFALKGVNLNVREGEFVAVTGENGVGKTTLALCLTGLIPHNYNGIYKGKVKVMEIDPAKESFSQICPRIGIVFSDPESQFLSMSVESEITFGPENLGFTYDEIKDSLEWALDVTGLKDVDLHKPPYELSGGQKQRVALAACLAMRPKIIVLDEPTSMLDPLGKSKIFEVLKILRENYSTTIIVFEHWIEKLVSLADRMILMYDGKIISDAQPHDFLSNPEYIHEKGVSPPEVSLLFYRLRKAQKYDGRIPITMEEAEGLKHALLSSEVGASYKKKMFLPTAAEDRKNAPVIEVKNLHFYYLDGTYALRGIDLKVKQGEFLAFIGQNGSGKTTLAKHLNGLFKPSKGEVKVYGLDTKTASRTELAKNVGYVFQNPDHQLFNNTVHDEIASGPRILGLPEDEVEERIKEVLEVVGLNEEVLEKQPFLLRKGLRQRVAIGSILAMRPNTIIVDEPTTGQDMKQSIEVMEFLKKLNEKYNRTIIIITHEMPIVARYAKRTVVLGLGEILIDGPTREVFSKPEILEKTFVSPSQITRLAMSYGLKGVLTVEEFERAVFDSFNF